MKKTAITLITILLCTVFNAYSQSISEFIIIDEIADNAEELISEFSNQSNVYVTNDIAPNALGQIVGSVGNQQVEDLHIYVSTKPGAIVFNSIAITMDNADEWSADLEAWSGIVSGKIIIHSDVVFSGDEGILLKERLEDITGLSFTTQN